VEASEARNAWGKDVSAQIPSHILTNYSAAVTLITDLWAFIRQTRDFKPQVKEVHHILDVYTKIF